MNVVSRNSPTFASCRSQLGSGISHTRHDNPASVPHIAWAMANQVATRSNGILLLLPPNSLVTEPENFDTIRLNTKSRKWSLIWAGCNIVHIMVIYFPNSLSSPCWSARGPLPKIFQHKVYCKVLFYLTLSYPSPKNASKKRSIFLPHRDRVPKIDLVVQQKNWSFHTLQSSS